MFDGLSVWWTMICLATTISAAASRHPGSSVSMWIAEFVPGLIRPAGGGSKGYPFPMEMFGSH